MAVTAKVTGNAKTNPVPTFESIQKAFVPLVRSAIDSQVKADETCRQAARQLIALRGITEYEGRQASKTNPMIPAGADWNGLSDTYRTKAKALWTAAISETEANLWTMRTGKPASAMPVKKNIDYYVEVELQAKFTEMFGAKAQSEYEKRGLKWGSRYQRAQAAAEKRAEQREQSKENGEESAPGSTPLELLQSAVDALSKVEFEPMGFDVAIKVQNLLREIGLRQSNLESALTEALSPKSAVA
jgi:hypothetical protein